MPYYCLVNPIPTYSELLWTQLLIFLLKKQTNKKTFWFPCLYWRGQCVPCTTSYHVSLDCHPLSCLAYLYAPAPIPGPNVIGTLCLWNWEHCLWLLSLFTLPLYVLYACTWRPENGFLLPPGRSQELKSGWWQVALTTELSCWPPWRQDIKANNLKYTQEYGKCSSSGGWEVAFQRITGWSWDYLIDIGLQVAHALNMLCSWGWPWTPDSPAS